MDNISERNFLAVKDALETMRKKVEEQEKRINDYTRSHSMMLEKITQLEQQVAILKVQNIGSGPTS